MRNFRRKLTQNGDTIVEVVLALTVLSLILGASAVLVSRNNRGLQSVQEHGAGSRIAQTQVEYLKQFAASAENYELLTGWAGPSRNFCLSSSLALADATSAQCRGLNTSGTPVTDGTADYSLSTNLAPITGGYEAKVTVSWTKLGGERAQSQLTYRIYKSYGAGAPPNEGHNCPAGQVWDVAALRCVAAPPSVKITVRKVTPMEGRNGRAVTCADPATSYRNGTTVNLVDVSGLRAPQAGSTSPSDIIFQNLTPDATYTSSVVAPTGYTVCGSPSHTFTLSPAAAYPVTGPTYTILPACWTETTRDYLGYYGDYQGYYADYLGYYADYWGYYSDPLGVYNDPWPTNWAHDGPDGRYQLPPQDLYVAGSPSTYYDWNSTAPLHSTGWHFYVWHQMPYMHYSAPYHHYSDPYHHYSDPYHHYSAPYHHYSANYQIWKCTP